MLTATVLQLTALTAGQIQGSTGRAVHGFWFHHWQNSNPTIAHDLHQNSPSQPFTLTPLLGLPHPQRGTARFPAGQNAWLRLTTLTPELSTALQKQWLPNLPDCILLADTNWQLTNIAHTTSQHPWANKSSYEALHHPPTPLPTKWTLHFETPTSFRQGQKSQLPFPLPYTLLQSWLRRWQSYAPAELPPLLTEDDLLDLRERLHISQYELKTVPVRHGRRLAIGCVGQITFNGRALSPTQKTALHTLTQYAFYCGSGHHTTQGMGLTQPL